MVYVKKKVISFPT